MTRQRLQLRADAYYAKVANGAYILSHEGGSVLEGRSIYEWIERIVPYLDGRYTLEELTATLSPQRADLVGKIIGALVSRGLVRETDGQSEEQLLSHSARSVASQNSLVEYFHDSPRVAWQRHQEHRLLILGAGDLVRATVHAGLVSGLGRIRALVTSDWDTDTALLEDYARQVRGASTQTVEYSYVSCDEEGAIDPFLATTDVLVHISEVADVTRCDLVERLCVQQEIPLIQVMVHGDELRLGTAGVPVQDGPGCSGAARRLAAMEGGARVYHRPERGVGEYAGLPTWAAVAGNQIAHEVLRYTTGIQPARKAQVSCFSRTSLTSETHRYFAHPFNLPVTSATESDFLQRIARLESGMAIDPDDFSRRAATLKDQRLGVFGEVSERDSDQLPLHVAHATVADPFGLLGLESPRPTVTAYATDFATARYWTALQALAVYCSLAADPRRMVTAQGESLLDGEAAPAEIASMLESLRSGSTDSYARALTLTDGKVVLVPCEKVFPATGRSVLPYRSPQGVAAAYSWFEAIEEGLLQHCREITVAETAVAANALDCIDLHGADLSEQAQYCLAMLRAAKQPVEAFDITGTLGVPTIACRTHDDEVAYGCGGSYAEALRRSLMELAFMYQARADRGQPYSQSKALSLSLAGRGGQVKPLPITSPLSWRTIVDRLADRGYSPAVVPLDHDPEVHELIPYIANVVIDSDGH